MAADRPAVMQELLDQGIATRRGIMCSHREPCYAGEQSRHDLPQSELAQDHAILLPLYAQMTEEDQVTVANAFRSALRA
jgi:perosamine synthetase